MAVKKREKTTWRGYSLSRVVWYSQPSINKRFVGGRLAYDKSNPAESLGGVELPIPRKNLRAFEGNGGVQLETGGESDVESISWHKNLSEPCGVLSVTFKPRFDYGKEIQPDDVLFVYLKGDKTSKEYLISVLSVDVVAKTRTVTANGATVAAVQLHCRDIGGKVLMDTPTIYDPVAGSTYTGDFYAEFSNGFTDKATYIGGPSQLVQGILNTFYAITQSFVLKGLGKDAPSNLLPFRFPGLLDESLFSLVDTNTYIQAPMVGAIVQNVNLLSSASNLWSLCDLYSNKIVNEMFIDVRDVNLYGELAINQAETFAQALLLRNGVTDSREQRESIQELAASISGLDPKAMRDHVTGSGAVAADQRASSRLVKPENTVMAMVHRQRPFDTVSFYLLPTNTVYETEVFELNVSRSAADIRNTFRIRLTGGSGQAAAVDEVTQDVMFGLTVNRDSIMKHGIKRYDGESIFPFITEKDVRLSSGQVKLAYAEMFHFYLGLVTTWHAYNELLWSGTISMRLRPDIRIGTRLSLHLEEHGSTEIYDYYIQGVEHNFTPEPGGSRTTLQIVRGVVRSSSGPETNLLWNDRGRDFGGQDPFEAIVPKIDGGLNSIPGDTGAARW